MALSLALLLLTGGSCLAATPAAPSPVQESLVKGLQLMAQLIQLDQKSPLLPLFKAVEQQFSQSPKPTKGEEDAGGIPAGMWGVLFKALGLHTKLIPAMAVNLLIFLAQMVSNAFPAPLEPDGSSQRGFRKPKSLLESVLDQPRVSRLLSTMQDVTLMDLVLLEAEARLTGGSSDCVLQLLCRSSPVVRGMQTSLAFFLSQQLPSQQQGPPRGETGSDNSTPDPGDERLQLMSSAWRRSSPGQRLFFFMPSFADFMTAGDLCRRRYGQCAY